MLDMEEINEEIEKLENCDCTCYDVCRKLAILYTVREHYNKNNMRNNNTMRTSSVVNSGMTAM